MNRIWNWNGHEYPFDVSDPACTEAVTEALAALEADAKRLEARPHLTTSQTLRGHCAIVIRFFNTVFGEGAGREIIGSRDSAGVADEAYLDFIYFINGQIAAFSRIREEVVSRYEERLAALSEGQVPPCETA